jgi:transposase
MSGSGSEKGPPKEQLEELLEYVNEQIDPIYQDVLKLVVTDTQLLRSLRTIKRGRRLTVKEQGTVQNILHSFIITQGEMGINLLKTLRKIGESEIFGFEFGWQMAHELIDAIISELAKPLAERTEQTQRITEHLNLKFTELAKKKEIELKVPENIQKELQLWAEERESAKKATQKYTG